MVRAGTPVPGSEIGVLHAQLGKKKLMERAEAEPGLLDSLSILSSVPQLSPDRMLHEWLHGM